MHHATVTGEQRALFASWRFGGHTRILRLSLPQIDRSRYRKIVRSWAAEFLGVVLVSITMLGCTENLSKLPKPAQMSVATSPAAVRSASGSTSHSSSKPLLKSTCDLLTKGELEEILGVAMRDPQPEVFGMCDYASVGDNPYKAVHVLLEHVESRQESEKHDRSLDPDLQPLSVPGIGEEAFFWDRKILPARLAVFQGSSELTILINVGKMMPKTTETLPVALRLAQIAVPRIP